MLFRSKEAGTRDWISRVARSCKPPNVEHMLSMLEVQAPCQLEHYRTKSTDWSFSYLTAGTHDSVKPRVHAARKLCFEKPDSSHSILTTGQKVQTGHSVTSRLELATQSSCESKPPARFVLTNLTLHIPFSL